MFGKSDVARSVRRYLSLMWDEASDWTIRVERRIVSDDERPIAAVLLGDRKVKRARSSIDQGMVEEVIPLTLYAYPVVGEDERFANAAAEAIADELNDWIVLGLSPEEPPGPTPEEEENEEKPEPPETPAWVAWSGPFRIPLWDYADVDLTGDKRAGPEEPHSVIWVDRDSLAVQNLQDPQDPKRRTVVLEARLSIERPGRTGPTSAVSGVGGTFKPLGSGEL